MSRIAFAIAAAHVATAGIQLRYSFIPFRDVLLGRTSRVTRLSQGDASTLADDDA